ncbi:MAG: ferric reductase-like transmembrane domain-containing protein [Xanthomonadales bacterium]|nr:ferric reductase-like transmembrane domain-containing protein [Xanthomonadales bacterium]
MKALTAAANSKFLLWLILAAPMALWCFQYLSGRIFYGEFLHITGQFSAQLLILTMALTALRLAWPRERWTSWLLQRRRYFGVATFAYAVPHLVAYLVKVSSLDRVLSDAAEAGMWTGWLAMLLFLPLAITSNNSSVRRLGKRWKRLHRLVYPAAVLTFLHWVLVAFDPTIGLIHAGALAAIEAYRLWKTQAMRKN